jgi:hypothetical protein
VFWFASVVNKSILFSNLISTENKNNDKVVGKLFLKIKSGLGFMGSLMHSLSKKIRRKHDHTIDIKDCNNVQAQIIFIWALRPIIEMFWLFVSLILHRDGN